MVLLILFSCFYFIFYFSTFYAFIRMCCCYFIRSFSLFHSLSFWVWCRPSFRYLFSQFFLLAKHFSICIILVDVYVPTYVYYMRHSNTHRWINIFTVCTVYCTCTMHRCGLFFSSYVCMRMPMLSPITCELVFVSYEYGVHCNEKRRIILFFHVSL